MYAAPVSCTPHGEGLALPHLLGPARAQLPRPRGRCQLRGVRPDEPPPRRARRPVGCRRVRHGPAGGAAARATSCTTSTARWRTTPTSSEEAGRRATARRPARPDRPLRAGRHGCSTWAAATACCSTRRAAAATRSPASSSPATAAAYAREVLGARRRSSSRSSTSPPSSRTGSFHVIVLADVLEHLEDPVAALAACERLLAPGGRALRDHAGPVVAHRAAGGATLVGATCPPTRS